MDPDDEPEPQRFINGSDEDGIILSEDSLRKLSKSLTKIIPIDGQRVDGAKLRHLQSLQNELLRTSGSTKLSLTHGAAALNSLCGFLEQCSKCVDPEISALPFAFNSWTKAFQIFLTRTENYKAKPVRRLLLTLTSLIRRNPADDLKLSLIAHAIYVATKVFRGHDEVGSVKAAIQVLEHFISIGIVDAFGIVEKVTPQQLKSNQTRLTMRVVEASAFVDTVQNFTLSVLHWVQYPDCAPAVGRFLSAFFVSLGHLRRQEVAHGSLHGLLPLWISPVRKSLSRRHSLLEVYEIHVLPGLLRLSPADRQAFLSTLPLDQIQLGNGGKLAIADIQLCILVARIESSTIWKPASQGAIQKSKNANKVERLQPGIESLDAEEECIEIDAERLGRNLLEHSSPAVRISAFALLVSSPVSTRLLSRDILSNLQRCIPFFHVEASAKARNEFIALMKKLCVRLRGIIVSLMRDHQGSTHAYLDQAAGLLPANPSIKEQKGHNLPSELQRYLSFQLWYIRFLVHELRPTASYQSHTTALRLLHSLLTEKLLLQTHPSKASEQYIKLSDKELPPGLPLRPLLDLLLDPFDDVRQVANMVIKIQISLSQISPQPKPNGEADEAQKFAKDGDLRHPKSVLHAALKRAESKAAETGRADHADGVGRIYDLLYGSDNAVSILDHLLHQLEGEVEVAKKDLLSAVNTAPLHGHLIALRHVTSRPDYWSVLIASTSHGGGIWTDYNERIMAICDGVWEAVRDVLCFDAPEGTNIVDEEAEDVVAETKNTLSYCWRALKESSSLMHSIILNKAYSPSPYDTCINFERFGQLSLKQLGELRHRGAFSTVSLTFAACCTACAQSCNPGLIQEHKEWYQEALACMAQNASTLTRRSAGFPAMITGVLAPYPDGDFFYDVILDLQAIADGPVIHDPDGDAPLPQVHALNCLKDVFTDARFGTSTEAHMADTLEIAASSLDCHIWAIRNCGLMLFKALLRRLNGGTDTASTKVSSSYRHSSNMAYEACPNLPGLILKLLGSSDIPHTASSQRILDETIRTQSVFAALEVIERSGIPHAYEAEILDTLWRYAECPDWSLREKAAKALSLVVGDHDIEGQIERLLSPDWTSQNVLHGRLLCLRFILNRSQPPLFGSTLGAYERLLPLLDENLDDLVVGNPCPITAAAFLDCLAELMAILIKSRSPAICSSLSRSTDLLRHLTLSSPSESQPAIALRARAMARYLLLNVFIVDSHVQHEQDEIVGLHQLPQRHLDAIAIMDKTQQFVSDENMLATLSHTSSHELKYASRAMQFTGWNPIEQSRLPSNPREHDYALALLGYAHGIAYTDNPGEFPPAQPLAVWTRMLQSAGSGHSELRTRLAAAYSLRGFMEALLENKRKPRPEPNLLGAYLALYDTLLDDDEDVRDQGATTVSSLLSAVNSDSPSDLESNLALSPPAAKSRLLNFIKESYCTSTSMYVRAAERLVGLQLFPCTHSKGDDRTDASREVTLRPVAEISLEAQMPQLAVFVEEKQNLYIDTVNEAEIWAETLIGLESDACVVEVADALEAWTIHGLSHFLDTLRQSGDFAFGPTSLPEVFTLFMRVILSAKAMLARSVPASGQWNIRENPCWKLLEELLKLGREKYLHSLLIDHIDKILEMLERVMVGKRLPARGCW